MYHYIHSSVDFLQEKLTLQNSKQHVVHSICLELLSLLLYSCVFKYLYTCLSFLLLPSKPCIGLILFSFVINKCFTDFLFLL